MTDFQRLEEIKKILDLSYNKMANAMGMKSPQVFYDIKSGKCGISFDVATTIQEYIKRTLDKDINISWLMNGEGTMLRTDATAISFKQAEINESDEVKELKRLLEEERKKNADLTDALNKALDLAMEGRKVCG